MYNKLKKIMQRKKDQRSIKKRTTAFMKIAKREKWDETQILISFPIALKWLQKVK